MLCKKCKNSEFNLRNLFQIFTPEISNANKLTSIENEVTVPTTGIAPITPDANSRPALIISPSSALSEANFIPRAILAAPPTTGSTVPAILAEFFPNLIRPLSVNFNPSSIITGTEFKTAEL